MSYEKGFTDSWMNRSDLPPIAGTPDSSWLERTGTGQISTSASEKLELKPTVKINQCVVMS